MGRDSRSNPRSLHRAIGLCYARPVTSSALPPWPALVATARGALWRTPDGTIERLSANDARLRAIGTLPLVCHAPAVAARLGLEDLKARDLLALFAFVRPAHFCLPTVRGLCEALDLDVPATSEEEVAALPEIARALIDELEDMAALASPEMKDTALAMSRALAQGATHAVLDNTYTTRATRASTIEAAKKQAAKVRGIWLDVPLHEAQVNVIQRMLEAHGRLLGPEELKKQRDNTGLTPLSHFRTVRELEPPSKEEGFDVLETRPFVRAPRDGAAGRFVAFEVAEKLERTDEPTFVFAWTEADKAAVEVAAQRLGATALICPHGGGPPTCWCRPPLPGLLLEGCHRAKLSPLWFVVSGSTETHQMLAATIGARFVTV